MKKLLKTLALTAMMVCTLSITANAATSGEYSYEVQADGTAKITAYLGAGGDITIPGTVDGYTVTTVGGYLVVSEEDVSKAISDRTVTSVTFPDSVTTIEERAFTQCYAYHQCHLWLWLERNRGSGLLSL